MLVIAILVYCVAGLLAGGAAVTVLVAPPNATPMAMLIVASVALGAALIFWAIGAALLRFRGAAGHLGWVLIGGGGMGLTSLYFFAVAVSDPSIREIYGPDAMRMFDSADLTMGGVVSTALLGAGGLLVWRQSKADARRAASAQNQVDDVFR